MFFLLVLFFIASLLLLCFVFVAYFAIPVASLVVLLLFLFRCSFGGGVRIFFCELLLLWSGLAFAFAFALAAFDFCFSLLLCAFAVCFCVCPVLWGLLFIWYDATTTITTTTTNHRRGYLL